MQFSVIYAAVAAIFITSVAADTTYLSMEACIDNCSCSALCYYADDSGEYVLPWDQSRESEQRANFSPSSAACPSDC